MKWLVPELATAALARVSGDLYLDHVARYGLNSDGGEINWNTSCLCNVTTPDSRCDVGSALFRLRAAEMVRANGGGRGR